MFLGKILIPFFTFWFFSFFETFLFAKPLLLLLFAYQELFLAKILAFFCDGDSRILIEVLIAFR